MPIIEYRHDLKQYHVFLAKTVEWSTTKYPHDWNGYVPTTGVAMDLVRPDCIEHWIFAENALTQALEKMTELWNKWSERNFKGVDHA